MISDSASELSRSKSGPFVSLKILILVPSFFFMMSAEPGAQ